MADAQFDLSQMTFGEMLRLWRRRKGLSQTAVAALLEPTVHPTTVSHWERDHTLPTHRYLTQLLVLTGIPPGVALGLPQGEEARP